MSGYLIHYGVMGQKHGVRNGPPYPLDRSVSTGSRIKASIHGSYKPNDVVFVSGKVKFDEPIPKVVREELDLAMNAKSKIIIGDAPGADTRCQDYLASKRYKNVDVYTTDDIVRNNVGNWNVIRIGANGNTEERDIRAQKDIAMFEAATKGIAISSDDDRPDSATSNNIKRMLEAGKDMQFYDYKKKELGPKHSDTLAHHGIDGQHWGVQNGPPYPLDRSISTGSRLRTSAEQRRMDKADAKWGAKQDKKVRSKLQRAVQNTKQMKEYDKQLQKYYRTHNRDGSLNKNYIAAYNQKLAEIMNQYVDSIEGLQSPSGMVLSFVAKRGSVGVVTAMRSPDYDMSKFKRGVNQEGKIAYRNEYANRLEYDDKRRKR